MKYIILVLLAIGSALDVSRRSGMFPQLKDGEFHDLSIPMYADVNVDCKVKRSAYDFAKKIMPEFGEQRSTFDALQLEKCQMKRPQPDKPLDVPPTPMAYTVFVNPINGGTNCMLGTEMKTLLLGIECARELYGNFAERAVAIRAGEYIIDKPIILTPKDSGLRIYAVKGDKVIISGAKKIKVEWEKHAVNKFETFENQDVAGNMKLELGKDLPGRAIFLGTTRSQDECEELCHNYSKCTGYTWYDVDGKWKHICYLIISGEFTFNPRKEVFSGVKKNIYVADLKSHSIDDTTFNTLFINGRRQTPARYPNGNPEYTGYHTEYSGYFEGKQATWMKPRAFNASYEINIDKPSIEKSLYHNYQMAIGGVADLWDPPYSYWALSKPIGGGGMTYRIPSGMSIAKNKWTPRKWVANDGGKGAILHAFQGGYWGFWMFEVDKVVNTESNMELHWKKGGHQESRGHSRGGDFFIENVFEELDAPGEWFYDRVNKKLYLYPNGTIDTMQEIYVSKLASLIEIRGSADYPVKDIFIRGIEFSNTRSVYMDKWMVPSGGDWSIYHGGVIFVDGAEKIDISYNIFRNNGNNNLYLANYVDQPFIHHNEFVNGGQSGIAMVGSSRLSDGTGKAHVTKAIIEKNLFHEIGLFDKQAAPIFQSKSERTVIRNNVIFNCPRSGINFNDAFGGGHLLDHMLMFNTVRETADHGPFNSWDRMPFITMDPNTNSPSFVPRESNIINSFMIGNYHATWPIDHDDGSCYWHDYHNVLVYGGFKSYMGHSKTSTDNIYIYPDTKYAEDVMSERLNRRMSEGVSDDDDESDVCMNGSFGEEKKESESEYRGTSGVIPNDFFMMPFCSGSDGSHNTYGFGLHFYNNECVIKNKALYHYSGVGEWFDELVPKHDNSIIYTPNKEEELVIEIDSKKMKVEEFRQRGRDVHTVFKPLPTGDQIEKWIREKLEI